MKRHRSAESGFTLVEIMIVVIMTGILSAVALPSLLGQDRTMRNSVNSVLTSLKTTSLTARANSANPYRILMNSKTYPDGKIEYSLAVDSETSGICDVVPARNPATDPPRWTQDPTKRLVLPVGIVISNFPTEAITNGICFNGTGGVYRGIGRNVPITFDVTTTNKDSLIDRATFTVSAVGDIDFETYRNGAQTTDKSLK